MNDSGFPMTPFMLLPIISSRDVEKNFLCISDTLKHLGYWEKVFRDHDLQFWGDLLIRILVFYCLFATLVSGVMYLYHNRDLLRDS